ncbi:MAG TPA: hypothetical protein VF526_22655 [Solirubrobacteraceae bacterium]
MLLIAIVDRQNRAFDEGSRQPLERHLMRHPIVGWNSILVFNEVATPINCAYKRERQPRAARSKLLARPSTNESLAQVANFLRDPAPAVEAA